MTSREGLAVRDQPLPWPRLQESSWPPKLPRPHPASAPCPHVTNLPLCLEVTLTLYGAEGQSEPHLLQHPQGPGFERGDLDAFLLATRRPLGDLHAIRLWHDNAGPDPSW